MILLSFMFGFMLVGASTQTTVNVPDSTPPYDTTTDGFTDDYFTGTDLTDSTPYFDTTSDYFYNPNEVHVELGNNDDITVYLEEYDLSRTSFEITSNTSADTTYADNQLKTLRFYSGGNSVSLYFYVESFNLEFSSTCAYDWLCVKGVNFCGSSLQQWGLSYIVPAYNFFTLTFRTDGSVTGSGFRIRVYPYIVSNDSTSYEVTGINYASTSGELPNFQEVSQSTYRDLCDQRVYGGTNGYYTDNTSPNWYSSTDNSYDQSPTVLECDSLYPTSRSIYVYDINTYSSYYYNDGSSNRNNLFTIQSAGYPSYYPNNSSCEFTFWIQGSRKQAALYFNSFDLERSSGCVYDSLCVNNVSLCGNWETNYVLTRIIPVYYSYTIKFKADSSLSGTGFQASLSFTDASSSFFDSRYEVTAGEGSTGDGVQYRTVTDYDYRDECAYQYNPAPTEYYGTTVGYPDNGNNLPEDTGSRLEALHRNLDAAEILVEGLQLDHSRNQYPQYAYQYAY